MEALIAMAIGVLTGCGVYLVLRARTFALVLGLTLLSYAVNLFLFATGRLVTGQPLKVLSAAEQALLIELLQRVAQAKRSKPSD